MNIDYKVGEVKLSYKPKFKNQQKVTCIRQPRQDPGGPCHCLGVGCRQPDMDVPPAG